MGGGFAGFKTTALINGYIHNHRAFAHGREHVAGNQFGCFCTGNQYTTDHQICSFYRLANVIFAAVLGLHIGRHDIVQLAQPWQTDIHDGYMCSHTGCHFGRLGSHNASSQYNYFCRFNPWDTAQQNAAATHWFFQVFGAFLNTHAPCNLTHGHKQRQTAVCFFYGFVGQTYSVAFDHGMGQWLITGKVEVSEEQLVGFDKSVFAINRFFNLDNHFCNAVNLFDGGQHFSACIHILNVIKTAAYSGSGLHINGVAVFGQFTCTCGGQRHAVFIVFDLFWYSDYHKKKCCEDTILFASRTTASHFSGYFSIFAQ